MRKLTGVILWGSIAFSLGSNSFAVSTACANSKAFPGLTNLGNTCFLNGALKLLAADRGIVNTIAASSLARKDQSPHLTLARFRLRNATVALIKALQRSDTIPYHGRAVHHCRVQQQLRLFIRYYQVAYQLYYQKAPQAIPGGQQDPHEFLQQLLPIIVGTPCPTTIGGSTAFTLAQSLHWDGDAQATFGQETDNFFLDFPVETCDGTRLTSVQAAADMFFAAEAVAATRAGEERQGKKSFLLTSTPANLLIHLNRYAFSPLAMRSIRLGHQVEVTPLVVIIYDHHCLPKFRAHYRPLAVEVHQPLFTGETQVGHYYTFIREPLGWVCHNDNQPPYLSNNAQADIDSNGYILNYRLVRKEALNE